MELKEKLESILAEEFGIRSEEELIARASEGIDLGIFTERKAHEEKNTQK